MKIWWVLHLVATVKAPTNSFLRAGCCGGLLHYIKEEERNGYFVNTVATVFFFRYIYALDYHQSVSLSPAQVTGEDGWFCVQFNTNSMFNVILLDFLEDSALFGLVAYTSIKTSFFYSLNVMHSFIPHWQALLLFLEPVQEVCRMTNQTGQLMHLPAKILLWI